MNARLVQIEQAQKELAQEMNNECHDLIQNVQKIVENYASKFVEKLNSMVRFL